MINFDVDIWRFHCTTALHHQHLNTEHTHYSVTFFFLLTLFFRNAPLFSSPNTFKRAHICSPQFPFFSGSHCTGDKKKKQKKKKKTGMPIGLRSEIDDAHLAEWYRQMYTSLNKKRPGVSGREGVKLTKFVSPLFPFPPSPSILFMCVHYHSSLY